MKSAPIITASMTAEFMSWKLSNPSGTAQEFIAAKTAPKKPSATINAFAIGIDPANLPRLDNGMLDGLAITNAQNRAKAAELKIASHAVSRKNPPRRSFVGKQSRYYQPD
jgi:hypothetical protein